MQAPLSYLTAYPYAEFTYAAAADVHGPAATLTVASGSYLKLYRSLPAGYQLFQILPEFAWMSLVPHQLTIAGTKTHWPGSLPHPIAMIDTGGGPVFLSDPNRDVCTQAWPDRVPNPEWTSGSQVCESVQDRLELVLGDAAAQYSYTLDPEQWPASVRGLTLVMCQINQYMRGQPGMNIGGISALTNMIVIDYRQARVGFKPR